MSPFLSQYMHHGSSDSIRESTMDAKHSDHDHNRLTPLLSDIATRFIRSATFANVTKEEAMDAISSLLREKMPQSVQAQLLQSLVSHGVLVPLGEFYQVRATAAAQGVFVPLTRCYSYLCADGRDPCFSPTCPHSTLIGPLRTIQDTEQETNLIPRHILLSLPLKERKRQAAIAELFESEQKYCRDLDVLRDVYAEPLLQSPTAIEQLRRQKFHDIVFGNYHAIAQIHRQGCAELMAHREANFLFADRIGATILRQVSRFMEPYVVYAANHVKAAYVVSVEARRNYQFHRFLETQDASELTRRLGLRHYLTLPTLRIGKYRLLIKAIYKHTTDESDQLALGAALAELCDVLARMNDATRRSEIEKRLLQIASSLTIPQHVPTSMKQILPSHASLIREGRLFLARSAHSFTVTPCHLFLFSHMLVVTRPHNSDIQETYVVVGQPIPLHMLHVYSPSSPRSLARRLSSRIASSPQQSLGRKDSSSNSSDHTFTGLYIRARLRRFRQSLRRNPQTVPVLNNDQDTLPSPRSLTQRPASPALINKRRPAFRSMTPDNSASSSSSSSIRLATHRFRTLKITHLGNPECSFHLACSTLEERDRWYEWLASVSLPLQENGPFQLQTICEVLTGSSRQSINVGGSTMFPTGCGRIWCTLPFEQPLTQRPMLAIGTQSGVWIGPRDGSQDFWLAAAHEDCQQLATMNSKVLLVLCKKSLLAYDLDIVSRPMTNPHTIMPGQDYLRWCVIRRTHVLGFTVGTIDSHPKRSSVLCYLAQCRRRSMCKLVVMYTKGSSSFHFWKYNDFRLPFKDASSVDIADNAVFVQSPSHGVYRVELTSSKVVLTPAKLADSSSSSDFLESPSSLIKSAGLIPLTASAGYVHGNHSVWQVHYGQNANLSDGKTRIDFESHRLQRVAVAYPYLIGFSSSVIEIRHIETGDIVQAMGGSHIRCVYVSKDGNPTIHVTMLDPEDRITRICSLIQR